MHGLICLKILVVAVLIIRNGGISPLGRIGSPGKDQGLVSFFAINLEQNVDHTQQSC